MQPFSSVAGCSASQMLTRTVSVSGIPVRFVLMPGRGAADSSRLEDGVIAGRHAVGPQQLPRDLTAHCDTPAPESVVAHSVRG